MESANQEASAVDEPEVKKSNFFVRFFHWVMNLITFGKWKKLTPSEKAVGVAAWNVSSWVTFGQVFVFKWIWAKVNHLIVPAAHGVWGNFTAILSNMKEAFVLTLKEVF